MIKNKYKDFEKNKLSYFDNQNINNNLKNNVKEKDKNINIFKKSSLSRSRVTCRDWKDEVNKNNGPDNVAMTVSNGILSY